MKLYFTRHGETEWNQESRMQGVHNSPLTAAGREQGRALYPWLEDIPLEAAYVSPLMRARETFDIALAGRGIPPTVDDRLKEASLGAFEGMTFSEASLRYPEAMENFKYFPERFIPIGEGAETFYAVLERTGQFLDEIALRHEGNVFVLSHALVLLCMRVYMLNLPLHALREDAHTPSCCYCEAEYIGGVWKLLRFGDV